MFTISKIFRFEAAHHLPNHDGKCARQHGHSWIATVAVQSQLVQVSGHKTGMVMDYGELKKVVQPIIDSYLDHWDLNETLFDLYPTSENIAQWLYKTIQLKMAQQQYDAKLAFVEVNETCTSACRYTGD